MRLSAYITALEKLRREHGDLEVMHCYGNSLLRIPPRLEFFKKDDPLERMWIASDWPESFKGEKVVVV